jgi:hypothetical protein
MTAPIDVVLARLEGVRKAGKGWRADSPVTGSKGAVSICEADSGAALIHDFSAASVTEVLSAIGLKPGDLYPERAKEQTPADRRANRDRLALTGVRAAADALLHEALVLGALAGAIRSGSPIEESDAARIGDAIEAIDRVRLALSAEVRA